VPFKHLGRSERGVDCAGLILLAVRDCGYVAENTPIYGHQPRDGHLLQTMLEHGCVKVDRPPQVDDILIFKFTDSGPAVHAAVVTKHPNGLGIVHTYGHIGRVIHQRLDDKKMAKVAHVLEWAHG